MAKKRWAISTDLRERAVEAFEAGEGSQRAIAARFKVSQGSLSNWVRQKRERGTLTPLRPPGGKRALTPEQEQLLVQLLDRRNDVTLEELADELREHGIDVSRHTVGRTLRRLGWSAKKNGVRGRGR